MDDLIDQEPPCKRLRVNENVDKPMLQTDIEKSKSPLDEPPNILNILNTYCLQEIFQRMGIVDLSNATEVCKRFKDNAEKIFSLRHEKRFRFVSLTQIKPNVFRNFAHLFRTVYLNGTNTNRCLDGLKMSHGVQSIHLRSALVDVEKLKPLLAKLKSLELSSCEFVGRFDDLFTYCHELQNLKIRFSCMQTFSPSCVPSLEKFVCDEKVYSENLRSFIEANTQLTHIAITIVDKRRPHGEFKFEEHLLRFTRFRSLTSLKVPCFQALISPLLQSLNNNRIALQQLDLVDCLTDEESFLHIYQMKSITNLVLTGIASFSPDQFIKLAEALPELELLSLETRYSENPVIKFDHIELFVQKSKKLHLLTIGVINHVTVDKYSYNNLVNVIDGERRKTLNMTIIYRNTMKVLVPKQIMRKNSAKIRIMKIKLDNYAREGDMADLDESDYSVDDNMAWILHDDSDGSEREMELDSDEETSSDDSIIGSDDDSDDNSDDDWLSEVYN